MSVSHFITLNIVVNHQLCFYDNYIETTEVEQQYEVDMHATFLFSRI